MSDHLLMRVWPLEFTHLAMRVGTITFFKLLFVPSMTVRISRQLGYEEDLNDARIST